MRAITLWQPWASLIALGLKKYETRSWTTSYRGKLLIHAAQRPIDSEGWLVVHQACELSGQEVLGSWVQKYGCIVAITDLTNCLAMESHPRLGAYYQERGDCNVTLHAQNRLDAILIETVPKLERTAGIWESGRYAWRLESTQQFHEVIPAKGRQGLWVPSTEVIKEVERECT